MGIATNSPVETGARPLGGGLREDWAARIAAGGAHRVVLADGEDPRAIEAAAVLAGMGIRPMLAGDPGKIRETARGHQLPLHEGIEIRSTDDLAASAAGDVLRERSATLDPRRTVGWEEDPLFLSAAAVRAGLADACVGGATRPTADVLRAALRMVGTSHSGGSISSSFLMSMPDGRSFAYGDCAVIPTPDADQLAQVALSTASTFTSLTGSEAVVAMLSYSTAGSAEHESIDLVRSATAMARERQPGLAIDGELQFDAALLEPVARSKAPGSSVAGRANVFIFPNLAAGNIGYKITQRLGGAEAHGPILQGLALPVNDLSRGCTAQDIVNVSLISILQAPSTVSPGTEHVPRALAADSLSLENEV